MRTLTTSPSPSVLPCASLARSLFVLRTAVMKRIDIEYGGTTYRVGGRDLQDLQQEISDGVRSGSYWLTVDDGEGQKATAVLHLSPGTHIALLPIPDPDIALERPDPARP